LDDSSELRSVGTSCAALQPQSLSYAVQSPTFSRIVRLSCYAINVLI